MNRELPYLTSVRGVCALAVLLVHVKLLPHGDRGVDVFFLLSGYVLTWGHMQRPRDAVAFLWARARRTLPTHLVATTLVGFAMIAYGQGTLSQLASDMALLPILGALPMPAINPPTWSLAVEWVCYLLFPLAVGAIVRWPRLSVAVAALSLLAAAFTLRLGVAVDLARGLTEFAVGAAVAALGWEPRAHRWLAWLDARPLRWLGEVSYPLYLIQALPMLVLAGHPAMIVAVALALGAALHYTVERPARVMRVMVA